MDQYCSPPSTTTNLCPLSSIFHLLNTTTTISNSNNSIHTTAVTNITTIPCSRTPTTRYLTTC